MKRLLMSVVVAIATYTVQAVTTSWSTATYHEKTQVSNNFAIKAGEKGTIAIIADMTNAATEGGR